MLKIKPQRKTIAPKPAPIRDARDPRLIGGAMRAQGKSQQQTEMEEMMNSSARAGAGGTKAGLVGLRPKGLKKASDLVDLLTPGKYKPPDRPFSKDLGNPHDMAGKKGTAVASPFTLRLILRRDYCPDCDRRNRPEDGGCINTGFFGKDDESIGVKAMDAFMSFFCQECLEGFRAKLNDSGLEIQEVTFAGGIQQRKQKLMAERLLRVQANSLAYIRQGGKVYRLNDQGKFQDNDGNIIDN